MLDQIKNGRLGQHQNSNRYASVVTNTLINADETYPRILSGPIMAFMMPDYDPVLKSGSSENRTPMSYKAM